MEIIDKFLKDMPQKIKDYFVFDVNISIFIHKY